MAVILHSQIAMQASGNRDINQRGARVPSVGHELGERDFGVLRDLAQSSNQIVVFEKGPKALISFFSRE